MDRRLIRLMAAVGLTAAVLAALAAPLRATRGGRLTADEPQYVLSAISLAEDRDLDIADELAGERYRAFHRADLPVQTRPDASGRELSPHDPLLPLVLAPAVALGGWFGAKAVLAMVAGALAALLLWTAVVRFELPARRSAVVVAAFALSAPLTVYGAQVYPELPAALAVTAAIAGLTGPRTPAPTVAWVAAVATLPWLSVKYVPVAAVLAALGLARLVRAGARRRAIDIAVGLGAAAGAFLVAHRLLYGGWTAYAAGDHFAGGEFTVVGNRPNHLGRAQRLLGLLVDRDFGLAAWAPAYVFVVPALVTVWTDRARRAVLLAPLTAGWLVATFAALTMHGWWWPGRQVVAVLPAAVLAIAAWAAPSSRRTGVVAAAGAAGLWLWVSFAAWVASGRGTLVIDLDDPLGPLATAWRSALPDFRRGPSVVLAAGWMLALGGWAVVTYRRRERHHDAIVPARSLTPSP